ncbi:SMI1/KNR4 family protein [Qipengyuania gaetbuli]|uniref:SMI1/KNR4 family protein n=1 Tax=Qipengyuania gaetbuli TaxID=266952 RepID=UPI001CFD5B10|nr:SMI1/KNR4 family protein [Qipengyuania gaetbuli]
MEEARQHSVVIDSSTNIEPAKPCSERALNALEFRVGRSLPTSLREFATRYGGAFIGGSVDGAGRYSVLGFLDLERIDQTEGAYLDEYLEVGALPFARCELGGIYLLKADNSIWFRLNHAGKTTLEKVSESFEDFLNRIETEE